LNLLYTYHTVLKLGIQEVILSPIKDSVGEMAHPYVDFQGTQPPRQLSESKDLVLFDCRLETATSDWLESNAELAND
jgi:hypothetical protein